MGSQAYFWLTNSIPNAPVNVLDIGITMASEEAGKRADRSSTARRRSALLDGIMQCAIDQ